MIAAAGSGNRRNEQGIAVRAGPRALRNSLFAISENRKAEISRRMTSLILGRCHLDERIENVHQCNRRTQPD
jgi:hypothetical protein